MVPDLRGMRFIPTVIGTLFALHVRDRAFFDQLTKTMHRGSEHRYWCSLQVDSGEPVTTIIVLLHLQLVSIVPSNVQRSVIPLRAITWERLTLLLQR